MLDLLYFDDDRDKCKETEESIKACFANAEIERTHDDIHGYCLSVELELIDTEDARQYWLRWLAERSLTHTSLMAAMFSEPLEQADQVVESP